MNSFILTSRAKHDLEDIWEYIAHDSVEAADRVLSALENAIVRLTYLVVYRHESKPLQVIRILHASRDVQSILSLSSDQPS